MNKRNTIQSTLVGVAAIFVAAPALACGEECSAKSGPTKINAQAGAIALPSGGVWVEAGNAQNTWVSDDDEDKNVRVEVKDGKVFVWVDDELKVDGAPANPSPSRLQWRMEEEDDRAPNVRKGEMHFAPRKARLGVTIDELDGAMASQLGIRPENATIILSVEDGSAAKAAGLRAKDVILRFAGEDGGPSVLRRVVSNSKPGDEVEVVVLRGGDHKRMLVELGAIEDSNSNPSRNTNRFFLRELEQGDGRMVFEAPGMEFAFDQEEVSRAVEEAMAGAREALQQALVEVRQAGGAVRRDLESELSAHMHELEEQLSQLRSKMQNQLRSAPPAPRAPRAPAPPQPRGFRFESSDGLNERVDSLEDRLSRIEDLLERLVDDR